MIFFAESEFQLSMIRTNFPLCKNVYYVRDYKFAKVFIIPFFLSIQFFKKGSFNCVSCDHRSLSTIIAILLSQILPINVFIGCDGLHSIMIDQKKYMHLYWNVSKFKVLLLKVCENYIIKAKRIHLLENYANSLSLNYKICSRTVFFIDQPGLTTVKDIIFVSNYAFKNDFNFYLVLHPRSLTCYSKFPIWDFSSNEIYSSNSIIIGYASTVLFLSNINNIPNYLILKNHNSYITDLQFYLLNNGTKNINQLLA